MANQRNKKVSHEFRMMNVYKKLMNYNYQDSLKLYSDIINKKGVGTKKKQALVCGLKKAFSEGWVLRDVIEDKNCPYKFPDKKRNKFLKPPTIENSILVYRITQKKVTSKKIYRLTRTYTTSKDIFNLFYKQNNVDEFICSEYFNETFGHFSKNLLLTKGFDINHDWHTKRKITQKEIRQRANEHQDYHKSLIAPPSFIHFLINDDLKGLDLKEPFDLYELWH